MSQPHVLYFLEITVCLFFNAKYDGQKVVHYRIHEGPNLSFQSINSLGKFSQKKKSLAKLSGLYSYSLPHGCVNNLYAAYLILIFLLGYVSSDY